jgi:hypothetical protein
MRTIVIVCLALLSLAPAPADLDAFMAQTLARRDDNWKRLQQYILDEREVAELRGPSDGLVWGEQREYTWYVRDGFFVRSPTRVNGVPIPEKERLKYEESFLNRARNREARGANAPEPIAEQTASLPDVQGFIKQTREPQFISSAYFLRFKFEAGHYGLVGRETIDNREVLKIEYYPTSLFSEDPKTRTERRIRQTASNRSDESYTDEMQRLMNKVSLVTLWVEPSQHQIVKFTFDNVGLDFLPLSWLARVTELKASMTMSEAFSGVWLPSRIDSSGAIVLAPGRFDIRYSIDYSGYREATVSTKIRGAVR